MSEAQPDPPEEKDPANQQTPPAKSDGSPCATAAGLKAWTLILVGIVCLVVVVNLPRILRHACPPNPHGRFRCLTNLSNVGKALHMYTLGHQGQYPPDLQVLVVRRDVTDETLACPAADPGEGAYVYVRPPARDQAAPSSQPADNLIVMCERKAFHQEGRYVLFRDGLVEYLSEWSFQEELTKPHNTALAAALREIEGR